MPAAAALQTAETAYNIHTEEDTFAPIPNWLLKRPEVSMGGKVTYARLCQYGGTHGAIWPKMETLAAELAVSESQARRYIRELEGFNLIRVHRRGLTLSNQYFILKHIWQGCRQDDQPSPPDLDLADMTGHSLKEQEKKKTPPPAVVVSLPGPNEIKITIKTLRPDIKATKSIRRTIRQGIAEHGLDAVLKAIDYTNHHSKTYYGAYLARTIAESWADGWTPKPTPPPQQDPAEIERQEVEQVALFAREQAELIEAREQAALEYRKMPDAEKERMRNEFLSEANRFTRRKCMRLNLDALGASLPFLVWMTGR